MKLPVFLFLYITYTSIIVLNSCSPKVSKAITSVESNPKGTIMFTCTKDGNHEVYTINADGSDEKNLSNNSFMDYGVGWSPDGKYILFYSNRSGNDDIWRMNADGSNQVNLTNFVGSDRTACYSPNGKEIAFISNRDGKDGELYLMKADGTNQRKLTSNVMYCESPTWTKDGSKIIFSLSLEEKIDGEIKQSDDLFIIDKDGNNQKRLLQKAGFDSGADVSPNGKLVAFYGRSDKKFSDIFIMNINGSNIINITNDEIEDYSPSWSPDGNWISYTSGNSKNYDVWILNIKTNERRRLTTQSKRDETPFWKPTNTK